MEFSSTLSQAIRENVPAPGFDVRFHPNRTSTPWEWTNGRAYGRFTTRRQACLATWKEHAVTGDGCQP